MKSALYETYCNIKQLSINYINTITIRLLVKLLLHIFFGVTTFQFSKVEWFASAFIAI